MNLKLPPLLLFYPLFLAASCDSPKQVKCHKEYYSYYVLIDKESGFNKFMANTNVREVCYKRN